MNRREIRAALEAELDAALRAVGVAQLEIALAEPDQPAERAVAPPPEPAPAAVALALDAPAEQPPVPLVLLTLDQPPELPAPPLVLLTPMVRAELSARLTSGESLATSNAGTWPDDAAIGTAVCRLAGPIPSEAATDEECAAQISRLQAAVEALVEAPPADTALNHRLSTYLTSRMRALQIHGQQSTSDALTEALAIINWLIPRLTRHCRETWPGQVHGLARDHEPQRGSWREDALADEAELATILGLVTEVRAEPEAARQARVADLLRRLAEAVREDLPADEFVAQARALLAAGCSARDKRLSRMAVRYLPELAGHDDLRKLRSAARKAAEEEWDAEGETPAARPVLPPNWPHRARLAGRNAIVVGGDRRVDRAERLKQVFGFSDIDWMEGSTSGTKQLAALEERIKNGTVDVVIVLRAFSSHTISDRIFGVAAPPGCLRVLADTYGVLQVRLGFERYLAGRRAA